MKKVVKYKIKKVFDKYYHIFQKVEYRNIFGCLTRIKWQEIQSDVMTKKEAEAVKKFLSRNL